MKVITAPLLGFLAAAAAHADDSLLLRFRQHMLDQALQSSSALVSPAVPRTALFSFGLLWHDNIVTSVFWVGEPPRSQIHDPGNRASSFDPDWSMTSKYQSPFYCALPYTDLIPGPHTKPEAAWLIPWFRQAFVRDGQSVCNGRWVAIRHARRVAYSQWRDTGPRICDDRQYVFGNARPKADRGLDVSPAVRDYLALNNLDVCDWAFVPASQVPQGPWLSSPTRFAQLNKGN
jgi:hypothetical protein